MEETNAKRNQPAATARPSKKPYQKPAVRSERIFETMALACGKVNPNQLQCSLNRKAS